MIFNFSMLITAVCPGGGGGYLPCLHTGYAFHVFGSEISLESYIFGSKICKHELSMFWGKNFQQLPFSLGSIT